MDLSTTSIISQENMPIGQSDEGIFSIDDHPRMTLWYVKLKKKITSTNIQLLNKVFIR